MLAIAHNDKNVLVYAYSPYCKQCKAFEEEFKLLSKKYKDNENIKIARLNAYNEEILYAGLSLQIQAIGYPTLFLFIADDKSNPLEYGDDDPRDAVGIMKFIEKFKRVIT